MIYKDINETTPEEKEMAQEIIETFKASHPKTTVAKGYEKNPENLVKQAKLLLNQTNETTGDRPLLYTNNELLYRALYYQIGAASMKDPKTQALFQDQNFYDWVSYARKLQKEQSGDRRGIHKMGKADIKADEANKSESFFGSDINEVSNQNIDNFDFTHMDYYSLKRWLDTNRNNLITVDYGKAQSYWNDFLEWGTGRGSEIIMKALMKLFLGIWTLEEFNNAVNRYHENKSYLYRLYDTEIE